MGRCLFMRKGEIHTAPGSRLPAGYTELSYIKSSGAQYIDTEFKPNNSSRVIMDAEMDAGSSNYCLFGARISYDSNNYSLAWIGSYFRSDYNTECSQQWNLNQTTRRIYDKNKETTTIDGDTKSYTNDSFQTTCNLLLLANNNNGSPQWKASAKLYSCQIYDNDVLIRDFVPCITASGEVGLYDLVGKQFYGNAGTGVFTGSEVA